MQTGPVPRTAPEQIKFITLLAHMHRPIGEVRIRPPPGNDAIFVDRGNKISLSEHRSLVFGAGKGFVRIRRAEN